MVNLTIFGHSFISFYFLVIIINASNFFTFLFIKFKKVSINSQVIAKENLESKRKESKEKSFILSKSLLPRYKINLSPKEMVEYDPDHFKTLPDIFPDVIKEEISGYDHDESVQYAFDRISINPKISKERSKLNFYSRTFTQDLILIMKTLSPYDNKDDANFR